MTGELARILRQDGLKTRVAKGGLWLGGATGFDQALRFALRIILVRILAPEDFGLMALVLAALEAYEALAEVGVRACVIQSDKGATREFQNAAFWATAARGAALCIVGVLAAPWVASYYGEVRLPGLLRVAGIVMLVRGIASPGMYVLEKELKYARLAVINQGALVLSFAATIALSVYVRNVWALVIGYVFEAAMRGVISYVAWPFAPRLPIDRGALKEISKYAKGMWGLPVLMMVLAQGPVFVLGKMRPLAELGVFSQASGLSRIPLTLFNTAIMRLMLPAFSQVKNDAVRLRIVVSGAMTIVSALGIPLAVFLAIFARPLLGIAYGAQYESGAGVLALAGVCAVLVSLNACVSNVFFVKAEPGAYRKYTVIRVAALLAAVVPAIWQFGIAGAPAATLFALAIVFPFQMNGARKLSGVGNIEAARSAAYGLAAGGVTVLMSLLVKGFAGGNTWAQVIGGVLMAGAAAGSAGLLTVTLFARRIRTREATAERAATEEAK